MLLIGKRENSGSPENWPKRGTNWAKWPVVKVFLTPKIVFFVGTNLVIVIAVVKTAFMEISGS